MWEKFHGRNTWKSVCNHHFNSLNIYELSAKIYWAVVAWDREIYCVVPSLDDPMARWGRHKGKGKLMFILCLEMREWHKTYKSARFDTDHLCYQYLEKRNCSALGLSAKIHGASTEVYTWGMCFGFSLPPLLFSLLSSLFFFWFQYCNLFITEFWSHKGI